MVVYLNAQVMEANSIFSRWDDLVFEHRNKSYGAYLLRRHYPDRLFLGLLVTTMAVLIILSLQDAVRHSPTTPVPTFKPNDGIIVLNSIPPIVEPKKKSQTVSQPRKDVTRRTIPVVTTDEVIEDEQVVAIEEMVSFTDSVEGEGEGGLGVGETDIPVYAPPVGDEPVVTAEEMPFYAGGQEEIIKFIKKHLRYPSAPRRMGVDGTVYVKFVVNGDGSVSNVEVLRGIHRDCDEEAVRVVSMLPGWKGGKQGGRPVRVRMVLPIKFKLDGIR
jgi:protein TonB